jgi:hypothetical protein
MYRGFSDSSRENKWREERTKRAPGSYGKGSPAAGSSERPSGPSLNTSILDEVIIPANPTLTTSQTFPVPRLHFSKAVSY